MSLSFGQSSAEPCEWKFQKTIDSFLHLSTSFTLESVIPVASVALSHTLQKQLTVEDICFLKRNCFLSFHFDYPVSPIGFMVLDSVYDQWFFSILLEIHAIFNSEDLFAIFVSQNGLQQIYQSIWNSLATVNDRMIEDDGRPIIPKTTSEQNRGRAGRKAAKDEEQGMHLETFDVNLLQEMVIIHT